VLFSVPSPGGRFDGVIYASRDGGRSWSIRKNVVGGNFAYSALVQLDADSVGLFYETGHYTQIRLIRLELNDLLRTDD